MNDLVIETQALRKVYGNKIAVADLTLAVPRGEVFGFLGPNGAGKSTSVKMLLGLVAPSGGSARLLGYAPGDPQAMAQIGFLPEHFRFHEWLQARELLDLHARLYGIDAPTRQQRIPTLLERVGLAEHATRTVASFSKGMLQRIGLAQALLNVPNLVFLDEPTSALDPFGRLLVRQIIHELKAQGTTVFLNSHLLGEVEATCDRVAFIKQGRVLQTLTLADMTAGRLQVSLYVDAVMPNLIEALQQLSPTLQVFEQSQTASDQAHSSPTRTPIHAIPGILIELTLTDEAQLPLIAERTLACGAQLYALSPRRLSLEQLFLEVVGNQDSGQ